VTLREYERRSVAGCELVPLDTDLDHTFPRYNPNPEDMEMLRAICDAVLANKADIGLGFDGDRCSVVDDEGEEIFVDKVGVMLAHDMPSLHPNAKVVKSTGLFMTGPVLRKNGVAADSSELRLVGGGTGVASGAVLDDARQRPDLVGTRSLSIEPTFRRTTSPIRRPAA
jgi:hypothetical protein